MHHPGRIEMPMRRGRMGAVSRTAQLVDDQEARTLRANDRSAVLDRCAAVVNGLDPVESFVMARCSHTSFSRRLPMERTGRYRLRAAVDRHGIVVEAAAHGIAEL